MEYLPEPHVVAIFTMAVIFFFVAAPFE